MLFRSVSQSRYCQRKISRELGISRKTVHKYIDQINTSGVIVPKLTREKILDRYYELIKEWHDMDLTAVLIHEKLIKEKSLDVSYPSVSRYVRQFKDIETYVPLIAKPGEEGQVDFGYLGKFIKDGKTVKVWGISFIVKRGTAQIVD